MQNQLLHDFKEVAFEIKRIKEDLERLQHAVTKIYNDIEIRNYEASGKAVTE